MPLTLSAAEVASLWHPPTPEMGDRVKRVAARWLSAPGKAFIDQSDPKNVPLGLGRRSDGSWAPVGLPYPDLRYICHITAPMGRGKSVWLKNLASGLLKAGAGMMVLDCKAKDLVNDTLPLIPLEREGDVTILDLGGTTITGEDLRASMNLMSPSLGRSLGLKPSVMASTVLNVFSVLDPKFNEAPGMRQFANMGLLALMGAEPRATLMHLIRFFGDEDYRGEVCEKLPSSFLQVKDFWQRRFPDMSESQKSSLGPFERRLDQMLTFPELQAMLVAPGCSINIRKVMDTRGILLAGVSASEGQITNIAVTLLLTQLLLAALSRTNVPEEQRPDWPLIIDEVQIIANSNADLFKVMLSQLRAMRVGQVLVHQNLGQIKGDVMTSLAGNAQNIVVLGSETEDAGTFATRYGALGLGRTDFTQMEVFAHQYVKFYGCGNLFSSKPLPPPKPLIEDAPPPVFEDWRTIRAPARTSQDKSLDEQIVRFGELARVNMEEAVSRLGLAAQKKPELFDLYCARTRAHREAQRAFILRNPGCVRADNDIPDPVKRAQEQKLRRIRILSALGSGIPKLETEALAYSLLMASRDAAEVRKAREEAEKEEKAAAKAAAKKGGSGSARAKKEADTAVPRVEGVPDQPRPTAAPGTKASPAVAPMPTFDDLARERGWKREAGDSVAGMDEF